MPPLRPKALLAEARTQAHEGNRKAALTAYLSVLLYLQKKGKHSTALSLIDEIERFAPQSAFIALKKLECMLSQAQPNPDVNQAVHLARLVVRQKLPESFMDRVDKGLAAYPSLLAAFYQAYLEIDKTHLRAWRGYLSALNACAPTSPEAKRRQWQTWLMALEIPELTKEVLEEINHTSELQGETKRKSVIQSAVEAYRSQRLSLESLIIKLRSLFSHPTSHHVHPEDTPLEPKQAWMAPPPTTALASESLAQLVNKVSFDLGVDLSPDLASLQPLLTEFQSKAAPVIESDPQMQLDLATAYWAMDLIEPARGLLKRMPRESPYYLSALLLLGEIEYDQGNWMAALDIYLLCRRLPVTKTVHQNAEISYRLAYLYWNLGDLEQCQASCLQLEQLAPDYRHLNDLKKLLQSAIRSD